MKKSLLITPIILLAIGVIGYLSIPFTNSEGNDFHEKLSKSDRYEIQKDSYEKIMDQNEADAMFIMEGHDFLAEFGDTHEISNVASVRKSIISALYGIAESKGLIQIDQTLNELEIDDKQNPLTEEEKKATVEDLLKARSGIYINAIGESKAMKEKRPKRGSFSHNEHYYYNNWDFNALGVIFEQETGLRLGDAFYEWIARPTKMKLFQPKNVVYQESEETSIPMYRFYMCAEDLARFGSLYANDGKWKGKQIIPKNWIEASFTSYSYINDVDQFTGYGYLWWLDKQKEGTLQWAVGSGGQYIVVDRERKITTILMNNTGTSPLGVFLNRLYSKEEPYAGARKVYELAKRSVSEE
ncbi:hypothetical protein ABE65_011850 [Fictibacillus phosphorivorans]|uniref:Beta-lactamase-related domain-containing protein n=1 Tax=Fictibacillus phosphorivorans TaxID=1221500 RepID=A0A160IMF7_9BACL|nr:serine hydrolase [Fictibacillus phosphorivorans]ANC77453.1 hypothetical protein ABE65_011850 [Fictibacillus phosphorivorans]